MSEQSRTISELMSKVKLLCESGAKPTVRFNEKIEDAEGYWQKGMICRVDEFTIGRHDREVVEIIFDETGFEEINDQLATSNYYDKNGVPCLNGKQAGLGPKKGKANVFLMINDSSFEFVEDNRNNLIQRYLESQDSKTKTYCAWLEELVLSLEVK